MTTGADDEAKDAADSAELHRRAAQERMARSIDDFYAGATPPLPIGVTADSDEDDDWDDDEDAERETAYWLAVPGIRESIAQAEREYAAGETMSGEELLAYMEKTRVWKDLVGPADDTVGTLRTLGISEPELTDLVDRRMLLAVTTSDGKVLFPMFQFDGLEMLAGLPDVMAVFAGVPVDDWTLASWLLAPSDSLEGLSVVDWLRAGRDPASVRAHADTAASRWSQ